MPLLPEGEFTFEKSRLLRKCSGSRVRSVPPVTRAGALIGVNSEVAVLARLMMEAAGGRGGSALIEGEPGIGKSALVRAALAGAGGGCQVFWGAGDELGQALPLLPLLDALRIREPSANPRRNSILQLLRGEVTADPGTDAAELTSGSAPSSLSAAIADRLGFVPGPVREVLRAAALLGVEFAVPDLATVLGRSVAELIPAVDEARVAGVLAESGNGLGFRHPIIRAALYDEIPVPVRAAWHRDAGRALAEAGAPADRVARQMLAAVGGPGAATEPMDEWMLGWLARTAELLVSQAPQVAAELLRRAVTSSSAGSARYERLVGRLADALYRVGDTAGAEQVASRALEHAAEPDLVVDLHWTLAQCRMRIGRFAESLATLDRALATPGISARPRAPR